MDHVGARHTEAEELTFRVGGVSDGGRTTLQPVVRVGGATVLYVAPEADDLALAAVGGALSVALEEPPASAQQLRLTLLRVTRALRPRPRSLAVVWWDGQRALLASTGGASVSTVRGGRVVDHCSDACDLTLRDGDRLALMCHELDERLRDAEELGRLVGEGPVGACGTTLVDVGRIRGGEFLAAVVAEVATSEAAVPPPPLAAAGFLDLDDLLAPLRTPPPAPVRPTPPRPAPPPAVEEGWGTFDLLGAEEDSLFDVTEDEAVGPVPSLSLELPAPSLLPHRSPIPPQPASHGDDTWATMTSAPLEKRRSPPYKLGFAVVAAALTAAGWVLLFT